MESDLPKGYRGTAERSSKVGVPERGQTAAPRRSRRGEGRCVSCRCIQAKWVSRRSRKQCGCPSVPSHPTEKVGVPGFVQVGVPAFASLVETAKAAGLEPRAYLQYLFETLPTVTTPDGFEALLPHRLTPQLLKIPAPEL